MTNHHSIVKKNSGSHCHAIVLLNFTFVVYGIVYISKSNIFNIQSTFKAIRLANHYCVCHLSTGKCIKCFIFTSNSYYFVITSTINSNSTDENYGI